MDGGIEKVNMKWPRVVNFVNAGGGDPVCTLHRAEGLHGWDTVDAWVYERYVKDASRLSFIKPFGGFLNKISFADFNKKLYRD